jgi:hypothetical protein
MSKDVEELIFKDFAADVTTCDEGDVVNAVFLFFETSKLWA